MHEMTTLPLPTRSIALRPLALPAEHGGWGFLAEPILLGLFVAPSWSGALVAAAAVFGFLARHPLKLALQDAVRRKRYPRTFWCRALAASYLLAALLSLAAALAMSGARILVPLALAMPLALVQAWCDAKNHGRHLLAEISGAAAMASIVTAIAIAGRMENSVAYGLAGIMIARFIPAILYVRALLGRLPASAAIAAHFAALGAIALYATMPAIAAMLLLLIRAAWGLTHEAPRAKVIGWREIAFGIATVVLVAMGSR
jgi:hypothetical protein